MRGSSAEMSVTKSASPFSMTESMIWSAVSWIFCSSWAIMRGVKPLFTSLPVAGVERRIHVEHEQSLLLDLFLGHVPDERRLLGRREVLGVAVHRHAVVVLGHGPEAGTVGLLVPVDRVLLTESREPLVGNLRHEVGRVAESISLRSTRSSSAAPVGLGWPGSGLRSRWLESEHKSRTCSSHDRRALGPRLRARHSGQRGRHKVEPVTISIPKGSRGRVQRAAPEGPRPQVPGGDRMFLEETPEQQALRAELRAYYAELLTPEVRAGLADGGEGGDMWRQVISRIGADGWLGIGWPKEVGGQGRPATDQFIFFDETRRASAPFPFVTINTVGPTMMIYGTEEQKKFFLPGILSGEINFAIGYTEPEAGTDLASLRTRAVRDGDEYVINGNKIFTSGADQADYIWLAVRTDPEAPKHKGISIICVPTSSPGFSYSIITTVGGLTTSATYYSDVHVPVANRIGEENEGWRMITTQLNHERVGIAAWAGLRPARCGTASRDGLPRRRPDPETDSEPDDARPSLGENRAGADARGAEGDVPAELAHGRRPLRGIALLPAASSAVKVFGTERTIEVYRRLLGIVGAGGLSRARVAGRGDRRDVSSRVPARRRSTHSAAE